MAVNNYEKIEGQGMWRNGDFTLETVVITGSKDKIENRKDMCYLRTYDSNKYNNRTKLETLTINPTGYLVMSYKGRDENDKFLNLEIFMSYKHIELFKNFISEVYEELEANVDKIYLKNKISPKFAELVYESEPMVQGKKFIIYPEKIVNEETDNVYNGIVMIMEDENNLQVSTEISFDHFWTLVKILEKYDLLQEIRNLIIMGQLHQILSNLSGEELEITSSSNKHVNKLKSRNTGTRKPVKGKSLADIMSENEEESESEINEDDEEESSDEKPTKKVVKKPINKKNTKTSSKKTVNKKTNIIDEDKPTENSMSLNDMLEAGEEYEFSLEDDENGEELF